jgi:hypothetical protein
MHLPPDLIELFLALDGAGVRYLLVGNSGFAPPAWRDFGRAAHTA